MIKTVPSHSWNPLICFTALVFQETDFVCFETGYDKFNNYDVDVLLSSSLKGSSDDEMKGASDQRRVTEEAQPATDEVAGNEEQRERRDNPEDLMRDDPSASEPAPRPDGETDPASVSEVEFELASEPEESPEGEAQERQETSVESLPDEDKSENSESKVGSMTSEEEPVTTSEAAQVPELKTTFGTTFDAVATDDETTTNVTPYEEEEREFEEKPPEDEADFTLPGETPLLSLSQEALSTPAPEDLRQQESPPAAPEADEENPEERNLWGTFGDAVFSVVTGGERTAQYLSSDEEEDDKEVEEEEEEEKTALKITQSFEETPEDETLTSELPSEPEAIEAALEDPPPSSVPNGEKEADDSEKPSVGPTGEEDGDGTGPEEGWEETSKPTGTSTSLMDLLSQDSTAVPERQDSDLSSAPEPAEGKQEEEVDPDVHDRNSNQESRNGVIDPPDPVIDPPEAVVDEEEDNEMDVHQEMDNSEVHLYPSTEVVDSDSPDVKLSGNIVSEVLPDQSHDHFESNESQSELPVEPPQGTEERLSELAGAADKEEEETQHLLEDENALSFFQSNTSDSEGLSVEAPPPSFSSPEPEYSDSVMRLTLLRDHFTEEKMVQIQKLLGLKNLFRLEAMFSDLDTELQATRRAHTGAMQDIESALEGILEISENTILDEIERMLDSQETKPSDGQNLDSSSVDEETEILDDFQDLAFSLRQKYSTASDSAPLAREPDIVQGWTGSCVGVDRRLDLFLFLN